MEKISLKEHDLILIDLFGEGEVREKALKKHLIYIKKHYPQKEYLIRKHHYEAERNDSYFQRLVEQDTFTPEELHRLIENNIRIQTRSGRRVFIDFYHLLDEDPVYTFLIGNIYDDTSEVKAGSIVEYVPNIYMKTNLDYFTKATVISDLNGDTSNLRHQDILVELENGKKTSLCMEEFLLVKS